MKRPEEIKYKHKSNQQLDDLMKEIKQDIQHSDIEYSNRLSHRSNHQDPEQNTTDHPYPQYTQNTQYMRDQHAKSPN